MKDLKGQVDRFLKQYGMDAESVDLEKNCRIFAEEMQSGLDGASSLLMIPTYITMEKELPLGESVIAIDAGGTNFRVAVIHFDGDGKPVVEDFRNYSMPGTKGEISKEEFFDTMADYILPVLDRSSKISFCFSYPTEILPNRDGRLIKFSKEVKVRNVEGEIIGKNLLEAFRKRGCTEEKSIIILNDTVATLLAGKASAPGRTFDSYIGFILGTGTNICYAEKCSNIGKVSGFKEKVGTMLINIESGAYGKAPRGAMDLEMDSRTVNPGDFAFEKTISGAYQGALILTVLRKAAADGLFSAAFASVLEKVESLASKEIDDFLFYPYGENILAQCCAGSGSEEDRVVLYHLIDGVLERAAKFVAFSLTAVLEKTGAGTNPCAPACITADGSTFYKSKLFRTKLDYYIKSYTNEIKGIYCEFAKVDNGTLIGTAIAGLLN
jgi:hexokinase